MDCIDEGEVLDARAVLVFVTVGVVEEGVVDDVN